MIDGQTISFFVLLGLLGVFMWKYWEIRNFFISLATSRKEVFQLSIFYLFNGFSILLEVMGFIIVSMYIVQLLFGFNPFNAGAYGRVYTTIAFLSLGNILALVGEQLYIRLKLIIGGVSK